MTSDRALTSRQIGWVRPGPTAAMTARVKDATVEGGNKIAWLSIKCNGVQCASQDATKAVVDVDGKGCEKVLNQRI